MIKLGHRGYSSKYPENTMLAFKAAIDGNFDGVETDVQLTKDNRLVLIHDEKIDRTSNGKGYVKDYTYDQLCQFNFNYRFDGIEAKIPLLEELLDYCIDKDVILNIEIKTDKIQYPNIERMTYMMIKEKGLLDRVMFSSFHLESLLNLRELDDSIYLGYLYEDNYQVNKAKVFEYRFNGAHPKYTFLNGKEINDYLRRGIDVNTWTVDSDDIKDFLVDEGVKTIITNKDI